MGSGRALAVAAALLASTACVPDRPARDGLDRVVSRLACGDEVDRLLRAWGASGAVLAGPPGAAGARTYRLPTRTLGEWAVLEVAPGGSLTVSSLGSERLRRATLDRGCSAQVQVTSLPSAADPARDALTDARLRSLVADPEAANGLVVYVWSPHMPLSVDGYGEIERAAQALGLRLVPALFAGGDTEFAAREARRGGIPPEGLGEVASVELLMRDAQVHAPTVLLFGAGRVSPVLPGFRDAEGYRDFLEAFLASAPR